MRDAGARSDGGAAGDRSSGGAAGGGGAAAARLGIGAAAARQRGGSSGCEGEGATGDGAGSGGGDVGERLGFEWDLGKTPVKHPARPKYARENEISGPSDIKREQPDILLFSIFSLLAHL